MLKISSKPVYKNRVISIFLFTIVVASALFFAYIDAAYAKPEMGTDCASCHNGNIAPKLGGGAEEPAKEKPTESEPAKNDSSKTKPSEQDTTKSTPVSSAKHANNSAQTETNSSEQTSSESASAEPVQAKIPDNNTCLACHGKEGFKGQVAGKEMLLSVNQGELKDSVHGKNQCVTCHENTKVIPHQPLNSVNEIKIKASVSCQTCHVDQGKAMQNNVHSKVENLTCVDCHDSHNVKKIVNKPASLSKANLNTTCSSCHQGKVVESYKRSFHGIALTYGYEKAAACTDCHGTHSILSASNPESKVSEANLANTCDSCHSGMSAAGTNIVKGKEHVVPEDKEAAFPLWITWKIFLALILFDVVINGTIPTLELFKLLRGLFRPVKPSLDPNKDITL